MTVSAPTEAQEQAALFAWAAYASKRRPELALLFHIPNGGARSARTGASLKRQGVKAGVPDLFLPVARHGWHGLFIELKRKEQWHIDPAQKEWHERLAEQGYSVVVCWGADEAVKVLEDYLECVEV